MTVWSIRSQEKAREEVMPYGNDVGMTTLLQSKPQARATWSVIHAERIYPVAVYAAYHTAAALCIS
jgi:hypothetical protein